MTNCHVTPIGPGLLACWVHGRPAPCPLNGQPATPEPIHVFSQPDQIGNIELARRNTEGRRPIIVHQGAWTDEVQHVAEIGKVCWCGPVMIPSG